MCPHDADEPMDISPSDRIGRRRLPADPYTFQQLKCHFNRLGITRVGDITGLDKIGVPVWFCCRPNSRGLAVSQGKGTTSERARLSAIMEALEGAIAEQTDCFVHRTGSVKHLYANSCRVVPFDSIMRCRPEKLDHDRLRRWTTGHSLFTGDEVLAPVELVGLDLRAHQDFDHDLIRITSVGMAAGLHQDDCLRHALFELIENDATALFELHPKTIARSPMIEATGIEDRDLLALVKRLTEAETPPIFRDFSSDIRLPVMAAFIPMPGSSPERPQYAAGFACRDEPEEAALDALLEAIQSRLTFISGARDDLHPDAYHSTHRFASYAAESSARRNFSDLRKTYHRPPGNIPVGQIAALLKAANIRDIYAFFLPTGIDGLHVVRVVATDLDMCFDDKSARMGKRLTRRLFSMY
jgi:ribosomal protein S12 methylthiotransferase accessory factor